MFRSQFGWLGLAAGLAGAAWLWARRPRAAALLFVVAAGPLAFVWFYYSANWRTWYTPLYLAWALAAGAAAAWFAGLAARVKVALGIIVAAAAVAVALTTFPGRFGPADKSYFPYAEDAAGNVLRPVGPKATFILSTEGSAVAGPLAALVTAARARPDVRFVDAAGTRQFEDFMARVEEVRRARPGTAEEDAYIRAFMGLVAAPAREYYVLFPFAPAYASGYRYESRGGVLKLLRPGETRTRRDWWALARRRGLGPGETNYIDYWTATFESNSYLNEARARFAAGDTRRAALCLARAERLGARSELAQNNLGAYAEARGDDKAAAAHYRRALALEPTYERPRRNLVMLYYRVGEGEKARAELETWDRMFGGKPATSGRR